MNPQHVYNAHSYVDAHNETPKKRGRDEGDEFTTEVSSFSEHRNVSASQNRNYRSD